MATAGTSSRNQLFALEDGNNFYVSCERVFNTALENHPVVVLSNNDAAGPRTPTRSRRWGVKMRLHGDSGY